MQEEKTPHQASSSPDLQLESFNAEWENTGTVAPQKSSQVREGKKIYSESLKGRGLS